MPPSELPDPIHNAITELAEKGDGFADSADYAQALTQYQEAFALLPEPKNQWEAATWLLAAIADAQFLSGNSAMALDTLHYAMHCPDAIGNPFLHLRFGQALLDNNQHDKAADELMRAYMGGGDEIFETEDPRYLTFLKTRAIID